VRLEIIKAKKNCSGVQVYKAVYSGRYVQNV